MGGVGGTWLSAQRPPGVNRDATSTSAQAHAKPRRGALLATLAQDRPLKDKKLTSPPSLLELPRYPNVTIPYPSGFVLI